MQDLAERVGRLERSVQRWRAGACAAVVATAAAVLMGAVGKGEPQDLTVRSLTVVNKSGELFFSVVPDAKVGKVLLAGASGKPIFQVGGSPDSTVVNIQSPSGKTSVGLMAKDGIGGMVSVQHPNGEPAVMMYADDKLGRIHVYDDKGGGIWEAPPARQ
jgi:hypothetical protein